MISILLPFKNEEKYIEKCIDSIIAQSLKDWELIAVDDHSSDKSPELVKSYSNADKRIKYILNPGHGVIDALCAAFDASQGEYVSRMDADDIKSDNNLQELLALAKQGVLAIGQVKYFREDGLGDGYQKYENWINEVNGNGDTWNEVYRECVIPSPCWLAHRVDVEKAGGFQSHHYPEDYDLCFRFYRAGLSVRCTEDVIHYWRDHDIRTTRVSPHYADNKFTHLKVKYFLEIDHNSGKQLVLVGVGKKGKAVAKLLSESGVDFTWLSNEKNKIGHNIYGTVVEDFETFRAANHQILLAVSNSEQKMIDNPGAETEIYCLF